jgi:ISXO2-like transposase domain
MAVVPDRSAASLCGFVEAAVEPGGHRRLGRLCDVARSGLSASASRPPGNPRVAEDFLPISHLIFSNLKSWLRDCHHGVSPQHLQAYLNEFTFRFNRRFIR